VENPCCGQFKGMRWDWLEGVTNIPSSELQYGSGVKFQRVTDTKHACLPRPRSINSAGPGPVGRDTPACRNTRLREAAPAKAGTPACRHGHVFFNYSFPLQKSYLDSQCKAMFKIYALFIDGFFIQLFPLTYP
jgi:hypothetical protein